VTLFLIGGGWDAQALHPHLGAFVAACAAAEPAIACVVLDEGDGQAQSERFADALQAAGRCRPVPVLVPLGGRLDVGVLDAAAADGLLVCGGLTPAYADALAPVADRIRAWLSVGDRPYAGFSAGSAVASSRAVVGGWRTDGVAVCPQDAGEDLDEVAVVDGLGLVPFAVDVHCAQWGTLPRLVAAVARTPGLSGVALDEGTMLTVSAGAAAVSGTGSAWWVVQDGDGVVVRMLRDGDTAPAPRG
jgi:cyanophycinase